MPLTAKHPDAALFPVCPFDDNKGRIRPIGDRFCRGHGRADDCTKELVVLADCLACKWPTSKDPPPPQGPKVGDVLARLLKERHGAEANGTCDCGSHITEMNNWGPDGCEANIETIVGWLLQAASETPGVHRWIPGFVKAHVLEGDVRDAFKEVRDWKAPPTASEATAPQATG